LRKNVAVHHSKNCALMSQLGQTLHLDTPAMRTQCPLHPDSDHSFAPQRNDAMCHVWTAPAVQEENLTFRESFGCSHVFGL
jgi:hypothetical protein